MLKTYFHERLKNIYSEADINTFFKWVLRDYYGVDYIHFSQKESSFLINKEVERLVEKLRENTPYQYIKGGTYFGNIFLRVGDGVLIPRVETEELCEMVVEENKLIEAQLEIIDFCTGSACIPIYLDRKLKNTKIIAIEKDKEALKYANYNKKINQSGIQILEKNIFDMCENEYKNKIDIIISNPPYILESEKCFMDKNVLDFEPTQAIFVKENEALIFYKKISILSAQYLKPGGRLYFEINPIFAIEIKSMILDLGFGSVEIKKDLFQKDRFVTAVL